LQKGMSKRDDPFHTSKGVKERGSTNFRRPTGIEGEASSKAYPSRSIGRGVAVEMWVGAGLYYTKNVRGGGTLPNEKKKAPQQRNGGPKKIKNKGGIR